MGWSGREEAGSLFGKRCSPAAQPWLCEVANTAIHLQRYTSSNCCDFIYIFVLCMGQCPIKLWVGFGVLVRSSVNDLCTRLIRIVCR